MKPSSIEEDLITKEVMLANSPGDNILSVSSPLSSVYSSPV